MQALLDHIIAQQLNNIVAPSNDGSELASLEDSLDDYVPAGQVSIKGLTNAHPNHGPIREGRSQTDSLAPNRWKFVRAKAQEGGTTYFVGKLLQEEGVVGRRPRRCRSAFYK